MKKHYIGIDPGKYGAIAVIDESGNFIGNYQVPKIGEAIDVHAFYDIFQLIDTEAKFADAKLHVGIEQVHAVFGSSAASTFTFGYVVGLIEMLVVAWKLPFTKVPPKEWQKEVWEEREIEREPSTVKKVEGKPDKIVQGKIKTKIVSLKAAKRLFPTVNLYPETKRPGVFSKNPDDGLVDALLIAEFNRRKNY